MIEENINRDGNLMVNTEGKLKESKESKAIGIKLSELTPEILEEILKIYSNVCGGEMTSLPKGVRLSTTKEHLKESDVSEWRFGSNLIWNGKKDKDAKLFIREERIIYGADGRSVDTVISFYFDPNIVENEEAKEMRKNFRVAVNDFLTQRSSGINP